MATENPTWGVPRIHGELRLLGIAVSERTVSRYVPHRPPPPDAVQRWRAFLQGHRIVCRDPLLARDRVDNAVMLKRMLDRQVARLIASRRGSRTCPGIDAGG